MRKLLKWTGLVLGGIVLLAAVALVTVYLLSNARFNQTYAISPVEISVSSDADVVARGAHIATIRGCVDCHGENLGGRVFIDEPPMGTLIASNLTSGKGGVGAQYADGDWDRAIRHGVGPDGKPLLFMPSHEFNPLSDEDLTELVSYIKSLPPVDNELPRSTVGPLGRLLFLAGELPLLPAELIDHEAERAAAPPVGPTAEYGAYLATGCMGCHGHGFSGGKIPGVPPDWPIAANLTPDAETGLGSWTEEDFFRALREGKRPDGRELDSRMPWNLTAQMTDDEIRALWAYVQSLPAKPMGNR